MWLKVGTTNKNPKVINSYFVESVEGVNGKEHACLDNNKEPAFKVLNIDRSSSIASV